MSGGVDIIFAAGKMIEGVVSAVYASDIMEIQKNAALESINNKQAILGIEKEMQLNQLSTQQQRTDMMVDLGNEKNKALEARALVESKVSIAQARLTETKKLNKLAHKPEIKALAAAYNEPRNNYNYGSPKNIAFKA